MNNIYKNQRFIIAENLLQVIDGKESFNPKKINKYELNPVDKAFVTNCIFGALRNYNRLDYIISQLMEKPLNRNLRIVHFLLIQAIYQLIHLQQADHAAVFETVNVVKQIEPKFANLTNGVLRSFLRSKNKLVKESEEIKLLPEWILEIITKYYPSYHELIETNSETKPPLWIRVNETKISAQEYLNLLETNEIKANPYPRLNSAIRIVNPCPIEQLPGFAEGYFTVQDLHAQFASIILNPTENSTILDACAAPGGKTAHLANLEPSATITSLELDPKRAESIKDTVARLNLTNVDVVVGDATQLTSIFKDQKYKHILLDVPCSATGVIRRNPDIRWLRRKEDIRELSKLQLKILLEAWELLEVGGTLLYTSCSILPYENQFVLDSFFKTIGNAGVIDLDDFVDEYIARHTSVVDNYDFGLQLLPSHNYGDGFYYCLLTKLI